jgi:succinoglycan biosynthesis transport protein ExoP
VMEGNNTQLTAAQGPQPTDYFRVVRERKWVLLVTLLIVVAAVLTYSLLKTPTYRATASIARVTVNFDEILFGSAVFSSDAARQLETGANLVRQYKVAQRVQQELKSASSVESLIKSTSAAAVANTDIIRISAISSDPQEATDVANSFATQFIQYRLEASQAILSAADQRVLAQLNQMTSANRASEEGKALTQFRNQLQNLSATQTGGFEVTQEAILPASSISPRPVRDAGFAFAGGLVLGILLAFLVDYIDRRIKNEETMEKEFGLPVLASVPKVGHGWSRNYGRSPTGVIGFASVDSPFLEAYRTLRSNLKFYQLERRTQTLLVTSGLAREGKTVTAINLCLSLALSGARVILVEADLRRPMIDQYLNLDTRLGVSSFLAGTSGFSDSLQVVRVPDFVPDPRLRARGQNKGATMQPALLCMTSGPLPPNPAELLSSPRMKELIETAAGHAEYVVVDTPPILLVSDALNLAEYTNGVIITSKMKGTTFDEAHDVRTMLERSGCRALGIVVNGVGKRRGGYYHAHYKGYHVAE